MGCSPEECSYVRAIQLAQEVVAANPEDALTPRAQQNKLAELTVTNLIVEKAAANCEGLKEEGVCGAAGLINDTRGLVFGLPAVEIVGQTDKQVGFRGA